MPDYTKSLTVFSTLGGEITVEARTVDAATGAEILPWATVGTTSGGVLTFDLVLTAASHFPEVRQVGQTDPSNVRSVNRVGVGDVTLFLGYSDIAYWALQTAVPYPISWPPPSAAIQSLRRHSHPGFDWYNPAQDLETNQNGTGTGEPYAYPTFGNPRGNGLIVFLAAMQEALGYPAAAAFYPIGGTSLTAVSGREDWRPAVGAAWVAMETAIETAGGPGWSGFKRAVISAGLADALASVSGASITAWYDDAKARLRLKTGNANFPIYIAPVGPYQLSTDADVDTVRQAQIDYIDDNAGDHIYWAYGELDEALFDTSHFTGLQYERFAKRFAQNVLYREYAAANGAQGPKISGGTAAAGGNSVTFTVTHDGGTTLKDGSGSTSGTGLTQFEIQVNGASRTITSAALSAGTIVIGFDGAALSASDVVGVRHQYGKQPSVTNVVRDDTSPGGSVAWADTVGAPLQPTRGWFTVVAA